MELGAGRELGYAVGPGRQAYLLQIEGESSVNDVELGERDALEIVGEDIADRARDDLTHPHRRDGRAGLTLRSVQVLVQALGLTVRLELGQRLGLDLADALPGHAEDAAHLVERPRAAVLQAEAQLEDRPLPVGEQAQHRRCPRV